MAKKEDRKKQKKRLREKKRGVRQRQHLASLQPSPFPAIVLNADCKNPVFRNAVGEAASAYSYNDDSHCPPEIREHYRTIAQIGWHGWYTALREQAYELHSDRTPAERALQEATVPTFLHFGTWLFPRLPPQYNSRFDPEHFFRIVPHRNTLLVSFTFMESVEDSGHQLYIPQWEPTIRMQGIDWKIGLYPHALDRLCSRLVPRNALTYSNCVDVFHRFDQGMLRFVPTMLADGQEAARVDFSPPLGTVFYEPYAAWVRKVLQLPETHDFANEGFWSIVLGYLPLRVRGKYARAKTFLLPGFTKTPEHALGLQKAGSGNERRLLKAMQDEEQRTSDLTGDATAGIKWYHDNGVPQIFRRDGMDASSTST
jgi:hypothetical protein